MIVNFVFRIENFLITRGKGSFIPTNILECVKKLEDKIVQWKKKTDPTNDKKLHLNDYRIYFLYDEQLDKKILEEVKILNEKIEYFETDEHKEKILSSCKKALIREKDKESQESSEEKNKKIEKLEKKIASIEKGDYQKRQIEIRERRIKELTLEGCRVENYKKVFNKYFNKSLLFNNGESGSYNYVMHFVTKTMPEFDETFFFTHENDKKFKNCQSFLYNKNSTNNNVIKSINKLNNKIDKIVDDCEYEIDVNRVDTLIKELKRFYDNDCSFYNANIQLFESLIVYSKRAIKYWEKIGGDSCCYQYEAVYKFLDKENIEKLIDKISEKTIRDIDSYIFMCISNNIGELYRKNRIYSNKELTYDDKQLFKSAYTNGYNSKYNREREDEFADLLSGVIERLRNDGKRKLYIDHIIDGVSEKKLSEDNNINYDALRKRFERIRESLEIELRSAYNRYNDSKMGFGFMTTQSSSTTTVDSDLWELSAHYSEKVTDKEVAFRMMVLAEKLGAMDDNDDEVM